MKNNSGQLKPGFGVTFVLVFIIFSIFFYLIMVYPSERVKVIEGDEIANTISIRNFAFSPAELEVSAGTTVIWVNHDNTVHSISGGKFNSGEIPAGGGYSYKFDSPGVYDYSCALHPYMKGRIVVK